MKLVDADDLAPVINRSLLIVRVKAPFIDWANSIDDGPQASLETHDPYAYLVDDVEDPSDLSRVERARWRVIFEHQLANWYRDPKAWPRRRSLRMFREWFTTELHPMVLDVGRRPIEEV